MNRDDIIRMAREVGLESIIDICADGSRIVGIPDFDKLERFAALVVAQEREACAKVCEELGYHVMRGGLTCADAIRERGAP